jgi:hypothetical protein
MEIINQIQAVIDGVTPHIEQRLLETVERKIDSYRRAVWVRDEWCCKEMTTFASHFWSAPRPKRDAEWGTTLHIRGSVVNYCPFCGVFVGTKRKA